MSDQKHNSKKPKIEAADIDKTDLDHDETVVATNKPKLYLDSRQWLELYANTHAAKSPISLICYLPGGHKQSYHRIYERDRRSCGQESASLGVFLRAWRCETPWIVIACWRHGNFHKCAHCDTLKLQIDKTPRTGPSDPVDDDPADNADIEDIQLPDAEIAK